MNDFLCARVAAEWYLFACTVVYVLVFNFRPMFFKALYEFVDLHQDGDPWGRGPCSRRFASRSFPEAPPDPPINFSSPRDVFLYGRGGARNIR